jgi:SAM-dependent methyltransferase
MNQQLHSQEQELKHQLIQLQQQFRQKLKLLRQLQHQDKQQLLMREDPAKRRLYFEGNENHYNNEEGYVHEDRPKEIQPDNLFQQLILPKILDNVKTKDNMLEVGCAAGYHTKLFADHFDKVCGIDFAKSRIAHAKKYETKKLRFVRADITKKKNIESIKQAFKFDNLYSFTVIHHIPLSQKVDAFDNLAMLANPNAHLYLFDGYSDNEKNIDDRFAGFYNDKWLKENITSWELIKCERIFRLAQVVNKSQEALYQSGGWLITDEIDSTVKIRNKDILPGTEGTITCYHPSNDLYCYELRRK